MWLEKISDAPRFAGSLKNHDLRPYMRPPPYRTFILNLPLFNVPLSCSNYAAFNSCAASQLFSNCIGLT
jgi:hypothetical protein